MNLHSAARALGGDACGRYVLCPGPRHSPQDRSLQVSFDPRWPDGFLVHSFAGDDFRECRDYVRDQLGLSTRFVPKRHDAKIEYAQAEPISAPRSKVNHTGLALAIWNDACGRNMNVVDAYLANRGIHMPDNVREADVLRFHPSCPFKLKDRTTARLPAMVGLMQDIATNERRGIHRTALKPDGSGKAEMPDGSNPKKFLGPADDAVVKLIADEVVTTGLGITEGIEDALTILAAGWRPMWSALSSGGIGRFPVLPGIECLTIFGDADPTGLAAAQKCQARWRAGGQECPIVLPPHDGTDWNAWRAG